MKESRDDIGESTITLPDERAVAERRFYVRLGAVLLLAALGYLVWRIVAPLWQPLLWAVLLGALLAPFNLRLTRRLGNRPRVASAVTTLLTVMLFMLPVAVIAGSVAAQAAQLLGKLDSQVPTMSDVAALDLGHIPWLAQPLEWLGRNTGITIAQVQDWLVAASKNVLQFLASSSGNLVLGALGTLVSFLLMLFVLFFVLRDGPELATRVVRMLPIEEQRRTQAVAAPGRRHPRGVHGHRAHGAGPGHAGRHRLLDCRIAFAAGVRRGGRAVRAGSAGWHCDRVGSRRDLPRAARRLFPMRSSCCSGA